MSDGEQSPPPHGAQLVDIRLQRGQTQVFDGLNLSLTQKRIGVIGNNGSGKSTLMRIMAGEDKEFNGEAISMPNMRIGFLPQEPKLDPDKTVRESVEEGMAEVLDAKHELSALLAP